MSDAQAWPRYRSHKTVKALEIESIDKPNSAGGCRLVAGGWDFDLASAMFSRYTPVVGDYLVEYEDGYQSFSPRAAFLGGYTKIEDDAADFNEGEDTQAALGQRARS